MFNPSQSTYGGYSDYWGGYGRPPVPPPPMPPMPPNNQSHYPSIPPPVSYRHIRSLPHTFRPPPPPPPPPERANPPIEDLPPEIVPVEEPVIPSDDDTDSEQGSNEQQEPVIGSPLVPRGKEAKTSSYDSPRKSRRREKSSSGQPVKTSGPVYKRPLPVELDPNLPPDLVEKFQNNHCKLCDVKLNSRIQSKNHYEGKPHKKKVKNYLIESARKDGESAAKLPKIDISPSKRKPETLDVSQLYCKCCDLSFTSEQHAQQHYMGRNHQRVLHGLKPLKAGYYNKDTGKWQRTPPDPRVAAERIGLNLDPPSDDETDGTPKKPEEPSPVKEKERYFCGLCGVSATSKEQLDGHMVGQRHMKNVRATSKKASSSSTGLADSILASVIKGDEVKKTKSKDFSIYRTPSGKYYCAPCDITLNSESQFAQHVESKKHKTRRVK
ncbi:zinc finger matrin-type protein 3-like isoform X1 [Palaemon carinicauda]|uniref:zinc finger matrin-type protein 3-like isoform X1 n=1 Tax=Palaemon carinicauda TaxID=392227 RepID=UPI0035B57C82